ncbi:putative outer membrane protein precursor [Saccharicrinis fermentans DSM 9555 = JCM 21142]|uniref:Putative outer membrane protein n=2 Tax=Saccharicrinis fermentans TaxID=982 RepID=W7YLE1_9BACT|nr:putative outer membrane protein precursor [Saccharicrinis fermentans DSM 9555 = JCM 21142]
MIILTVLSIHIYAEGYQVNVQSQKNTAMGHTGTGLLLGTSSIHFNPGALGFMQKDFEFSFGGTAVFSKVSYSQKGSNYQSETDSPIGTPFYAYAAKKINEKLVLGIGLTTPYGNSLAWEDDWAGRYLIQNISLSAIVAQPTLSYRLSDKWGIGIGAMVVFGSVDLNRALPVDGTVPGSVSMEGSTTALGFNVGAFFKASPQLSLGLNYRSKVTMEMEGGDADFTVPSALRIYFPSGNKFDAELPLPANLTLGVGYQINDKVTLAADFQYVFWDAYKELYFDFETNTSLLADSPNPRNYENTLIYRLGAEYKQSENLILRAGIYFDETPVSEDYLNPETPGMNKIGMSTGASYMLNDKLTVDLSLLFIVGLDRDASYLPANFSGTYDSQAFLPGVGLTYSF